MSAAISPSPNSISALEKNELYQIGRDFWNVRGHFKILAKLVDIETQMSIIRLPNGRFLVVDTVEMNDQLRQEINHLTNNGEKIEAVLGTHPFHTLAFPAFYQSYPNAHYYGTPRHLRRLTDIPWKGSLDDCHVRKLWEPQVELRIPAGAEFVDPQPESSNHFISVFVFHRPSATLHVDDTIVYAEKPSFLLKLFGFKDGAMAFHPSIKSHGLYPTADAPFLFRDWMRDVLRDWPFDNLCCAHLGVKRGGAHADVQTLLDKAQPLFDKLAEKNRKRNPDGQILASAHPMGNVQGDECG